MRGIYTLEKNMDMEIGGKKIYYVFDQIRQVFITCPDLMRNKTKKSERREIVLRSKGYQIIKVSRL